LIQNLLKYKKGGGRKGESTKLIPKMHNNLFLSTKGAKRDDLSYLVAVLDDAS